VPVAAPEWGLAATEIYFHAEDVRALTARLGAAGARPLSPLSLRDWGD
jgi:hypothetical protein